MEIEFILKMKEDFGFISGEEMDKLITFQLELAELFKKKFDAKIEHHLDIKGKVKKE